MRRALIVAAVLLLLAVAGYGLYWLAAARTLADGIESWAAQQRQAGYHVSYEAPEIGGFPFDLEARVGAPEIAAPPGAFPWRWRGPALLLHARPWTPLDAEASIPGQHDIEIGQGEDLRHYVLDAHQATGGASVALDGKLSEITASLRDVLVTELGRDDRTLLAESAEIAVQPRDARDHTEPSLDFRLALAGIVLPANTETPLGRNVERLEIDGAVLGRLAYDGGTLQEALARWRDDGGTLELERVAAHAGPLGLTGSATVALDAALQPVGAMSATISGHAATLDALVAAGAVSPRDGSIAKLLLAALSSPSPVDGEPEITAPLTLQDGYLWVGPARLAPLPRIRWP